MTYIENRQQNTINHYHGFTYKYNHIEHVLSTCMQRDLDVFSTVRVLGGSTLSALRAVFPHLSWKRLHLADVDSLHVLRLLHFLHLRLHQGRAQAQPASE